MNQIVQFTMYIGWGSSQPITKYIKLQSSTVYAPLFGIGTPPSPLPQASCTPPGTKGGMGGTLDCGCGESQFRRLERMLSTLSTLCSLCKANQDCQDISSYLGQYTIIRELAWRSCIDILRYSPRSRVIFGKCGESPSSVAVFLVSTLSCVTSSQIHSP